MILRSLFDQMSNVQPTGIGIRCRVCWLGSGTTRRGNKNSWCTCVHKVLLYYVSRNLSLLASVEPPPPYWVRARLSKQHRAAHCAHTCYKFGTHTNMRKQATLFSLWDPMCAQEIDLHWDDTAQRYSATKNHKIMNIFNSPDTY
jgi:hypothetical protein